MPTGDTAPQPPPTEPCDDCRHEPCVCVQPTPEQAAELLADYQQWLYARGEKDRRITALEAQLAEAQARLAMAAEALFAYGDRNEMTANPWWAIVAKNRMGSNAILAGPFFSRERAEEHRQARLYEYGEGSIVFCFSGHISQHYKDLRAALTATAPAVAKFLAGVERRGAAKELRDLAKKLRDGARVLPCPPGAHEWRVVYADGLCARADELEGA